MGNSGLEESEDSSKDRQLGSLSQSPTLDKQTSMIYRRLRISSWAELFSRLMRTAFLQFMSLCSVLGLLILLAFWFYDGITLLILLHFAVLGVLYNGQDKLLYYPEQPAQSRLFVELPSMYGLPYESLTTRTQDGVQINMFLIRQPPNLISAAPTVIYFHGNAGNIGHRLVNAYGLYHHCKANILLVEYRGYGKSQGHPSEAGMYLDAQAAVDYISSRSDINQQKLVVFGRSLGGAVAVHVCSMPYYASRIACLVVENTFTSIPDMAYKLFDFHLLHYIPDWCFKNKFLSRYRIDKVKMPSLFICGLKDNLVPPKMMLQLYNMSGSQLKRIAVFQDGTHNETWQCRGYYDAIKHFLSEVDQFSRGVTVAADASYPISDREGEEDL